MKTRILVVEDDVDLLELLRVSLKDAGYLVQTAMTGEAGLELSLTFSPDLILLDVMLPEMNGFNVCVKLRSHHATATTPIIIMTTLTGSFPRFEGMQTGCNDYISKPFAARDLLSRIENLLHRRPVPSDQTGLTRREADVG